MSAYNNNQRRFLNNHYGHNQDFEVHSYTTSRNQITNGDSSSSSKGVDSSLFVSNKFSSATNSYVKPYKHNELPWSSMLPSSHRYPLTKSSTTVKVNNLFGSNDTRTSSMGNSNYYHANRAANNNIYASELCRSPSYKTSAYFGRSVFDSSSFRAPAIYQPSGKTYDGQVRRAVTTKERNYVPPKLIKPTSNQSQPAEVCKEASTQRPLRLNNSYSKPIESKPHASTASSDMANRSTGSKPFRTTSLKLRNSYNNILDQLANTTLSMLKLSSSKQPNKPELEALVERSEGSERPKSTRHDTNMGSAIRIASPGSSVQSSASASSHQVGLSPISSSPSNQISTSPMEGVQQMTSNLNIRNITPKGSSSSGCGTSEQGDDDEITSDIAGPAKDSAKDIKTPDIRLDDLKLKLSVDSSSLSDSLEDTESSENGLKLSGDERHESTVLAKPISVKRDPIEVQIDGHKITKEDRLGQLSKTFGETSGSVKVPAGDLQRSSSQVISKGSGLKHSKTDCNILSRKGREDDIRFLDDDDGDDEDDSRVEGEEIELEAEEDIDEVSRGVSVLLYILGFRPNG